MPILAVAIVDELLAASPVGVEACVVQSIGGGGGNDDDDAVAVVTYASIIAMNLSQKGGRLGRQREIES